MKLTIVDLIRREGREPGGRPRCKVVLKKDGIDYGYGPFVEWWRAGMRGNMTDDVLKVLSKPNPMLQGVRRSKR